MVDAAAVDAAVDAAARAAGARRHGELRFLGLTALGLALFPFVFHLIGGYAGLATQILIVAIAAVGFNLLLGYAGPLSYGHAAFYGVGGYTAALVLMRLLSGAPNFWLALFAAAIATAIAAIAIGALVVRLYGIYFALLTLAFAQMCFFIVFKWRSVTGGDDGLQGIPTPAIAIGGWRIDPAAALPALPLGPFGDLSDLKVWYVVAALALLLVLWFVRRLVASQFGEVLAAIRENEDRSVAIGFDPTRYKLAAFAISGTLAGISGALRVMYEGSVSVDYLSIDQSGNFVIYTIIGGVQTLFGPVLGTALILYLQNILSAKTEAWRLIEGLIFVAIVVFCPAGLLGAFRADRRVSLARLFAGGAGRRRRAREEVAR